MAMRMHNPPHPGEVLQNTVFADGRLSVTEFACKLGVSRVARSRTFKQGGAERMIEISKRETFYQQEYCGCVYSLRDRNRYRRRVGRETIKIGVKYYGRPD